MVGKAKDSVGVETSARRMSAKVTSLAPEHLTDNGNNEHGDREANHSRLLPGRDLRTGR